MLNRERVNVGRSVYNDRIRQILKSSQNSEVNLVLLNAYIKKDKGYIPDELLWTDISNKALNEMAKSRNIICVTNDEIKERPEIIEDIKDEGLEIVVVNDKEKRRADEQVKQGKTRFHNIKTWKKSFNESFEYQFVERSELSDDERNIYDLYPDIIGMVGLKKTHIPKILISETMRKVDNNTDGVWDAVLHAIVIKRSKLAAISSFAGILLHELAHSTTGASDCTREFENILTNYLGKISMFALCSEGKR